MDFIVIVKHIHGISYWNGSAWGAKRTVKRYTLDEARKVRGTAWVDNHRDPDGSGKRARAEVAEWQRYCHG